MVTGGGGGIGGATCRVSRWKARGSPCSTATCGGEGGGDGHHAAGGGRTPVECDITDRASVDAAVADDRKKTLGPMPCW
jgi:2-hydroxycyclohexanecarboxyl-CoA dehydrogenase